MKMRVDGLDLHPVDILTISVQIISLSDVFISPLEDLYVVTSFVLAFLSSRVFQVFRDRASGY